MIHSRIASLILLPPSSALALVHSINGLQSQSVQRVSCYKTITRFVNDLKENPDYDGLAITGHSLGGGIAMISAAQTGVGSVAVSGPNAKLSRLSFDPQLTVEQLNTKTFNVIPHRDLIPMFDDRAQNFSANRLPLRQSKSTFLPLHWQDNIM